MQTWQEAPEALRGAIEALELVPVDERLTALRGLVNEDGTELAEELARILVARKLGRRRVAQMSDVDVRAKAEEVMRVAVASGQLTEPAMREILAAGDLRTRVIEFIANGYLRTSPRANPKLQRILRGEAGPSSLDDEVE
jgi:hypothetical protein